MMSALYVLNCHSSEQAAQLKRWFANAHQRPNSNELVVALDDRQVIGLQRDYQIVSTPLKISVVKLG